MPRVSIGLPIADERPQMIELTVRSILAQSTGDWELIIICDGAPAATVARLKQIDDNRIRIYAHSKRAGLAARLNQLPRLATGKYLARMDADDIMMPNRLEQQLSVLDSDSSIDVLTSRAIVIDEVGRIVGQTRDVSLPVDGRSILQSNPFVHPTAIARTTWWRDHPYDESLPRGQDHALWLTASDHTSFGWDPIPAIYYRVSTSLDPRKYARSRRSARRVVRMYGPNLAGWSTTSRLILTSFAKQYAVRIASTLNRGDIVLSKRFVSLTPAKRRVYQDVLDSLSNTHGKPNGGPADIPATPINNDERSIGLS